MSAPRRIGVLTATHVAGERGGAERFYENLIAALNQVPGIQAEQVAVVSDESSFDAILESYLRSYDLDLSAFDGVISTKAPTYVVRHPNHVCYLLHTMRVFYDMFDRECPQPSPEQFRQRDLIHRLDSAALVAPRTRRVFVIGHEVRRRLLRHNGHDSEVLYPALSMSGLRQGEYQYAFLPGRLHRWKRVDLVIKAMAHVERPLVLRLAGTGEDEPLFRKLAAGDGRIVFHGRVSEQELIDLYANALVVPFAPEREDYGLVTLEAFQCHKPVITCRDSGEPAEIVQHGQSGFVCAPDPRAIAEHLQFLFDNPAEARQMGARGAAWLEQVRWDLVASRLVDALGFETR